jgi:DNA polymerase-3 subunit beta
VGRSRGTGPRNRLNARYLADVLTNVDADQFALELNGPLSPGVFKPIGDDHYIHVVMPVRTTS